MCLTMFLILALVLDPSQKTKHIRRYWGEDKLEGVLERAAETVSLLKSNELMLQVG